MVLSDELRKKYAFLLQPMKDLTKNWEVDVAHVLENYMEDLDKMTFSLDNGNTVVNFAEASLLIQGTACVWSKKVEYLYTLVIQTLDMITSKQAAEKNTENTTKDKTENVNFEDEDGRLLSLNDIKITSERVQSCEYDQVELHPFVPVAMLENDTDNRGRVIINLNKDDMSSHTNDFWEAAFIPLQKKISFLDRDTGGALEKLLVLSMEDMESSPMNVVSESAYLPAEPDPTEPIEDDFADDAGGCDDMDDFDPEENPPQIISEELKVTIHGLKLRNRGDEDKLVSIHKAEELPKIIDPHEQYTGPTWTVKPYQKLKSFRIPESIMKPTRKRKLHGSSPKKVPTISEYMMKKVCSKKQVKTECLNLSAFIQAERRVRNQLWKNIKKEVSHLKSEEMEALGMPGKDVGNDSVFDEDVFAAEGNDFADHSDGFSPDLDDLIGDVAGAQGQDLNSCPGGTAEPTGTYEDLVRHHVEMFYQAARRHKEESALAQRVTLWEEAITPRLAKQDLRPEFDIHKYGDVMLGKFQNPKDKKKFEEIVQSPDPWYICRLFAATLQLVNDNNFTISKHEDFSQSVNTMALTLLSHHKLRERLDEYTAQT